MKKITFLLFIIYAFQSEQLQAQVYKRIIGIDSVGLTSNFPPYLFSGFRFTYPNQSIGNREEVRSLYVYYYFPSNFYEDCHLYSKFNFSTLQDTVHPTQDTTHNLSWTNNVLSINNKQKVFMNNGRVSCYFDGIDTTSRFYYNSNGQLISEIYKKSNYGFSKVTYQYNNQSLLSSKDIEVNNSSTRYYTLYNYNGSGVMTEKTDSTLSSGNTYITRYKFKQVGSVKIVNYNNGNSNSDDSMFYNSSGLLDSIKSSSTYGTNVFYYYDSNDYLDSVVYKRYYQTDKVILYWETYNPNSSGISDVSVKEDHGIAVYPNPSAGRFNIELNIHGSTMTMFNSLGQSVKEIKLQQGINTIDAEGLAKGIYFLKFGELNESRKIMIE